MTHESVDGVDSETSVERGVRSTGRDPSSGIRMSCSQVSSSEESVTHSRPKDDADSYNVPCR